MKLILRMVAALTLAMIGVSTPALVLAGDKPLVIESAKIKQLPAATTLQINASGTGAASINIPHGTAPTSPANGDCWTTTSVLACRINSTTATVSGSNTGDQTITLTGNVTGSGTGSFATTIAANAVTRGNLAATGGAALLGATAAGNVADLTGTQATTLLDTFSSTLKGLAPASGGGTTNYLRADGSWAAPAGGGSGITAKDEGSTLTTGVTSLDFVGAGVTATNSSGAVTVTVPGVPAFRGALVTKSADQTGINATGAGVIVPWTTETGGYDTDTIHDNTTNNDRLTVPSGVTKVRIGWGVLFQNVASTSYVYIDVQKNGTSAFTGFVTAMADTSSAFPRIGVWSPVLNVSSGDYFRLLLVSETDTSIDIFATYSWFAMEIIG